MYACALEEYAAFLCARHLTYNSRPMFILAYFMQATGFHVVLREYYFGGLRIRLVLFCFVAFQDETGHF